MEKRTKNRSLLFIAVFLLITGTAGVVFAIGDETMDVATVSVMATSGGVATTVNPVLITDGNITTAGIETNAFIDSNILIKFNQNVANDDNTKSKINLQKIKTNGSLDTTALINNSGISILNKNLTIDPMVNLSTNTYYLVTVSPGVCISGSAVSSTTTYQAIFKTGTESQTATATTTFSAIMTSPAYTGSTVTDAVNINNAVFSFTFSEAVKNNGLNGNGLVTITKISGGSQEVASNGAIVASTVSGEKISFPTMGTSGSTSTAFTVDATALEASTTYQLKLKSTVASVTSKTLGSDLIFTFTTSDSSSSTVTFQAINLYPTNNAKDIATDSNLVIGFTEAIMASDNIINGKAIELLDVTEATTLPAVFILGDEATFITVDPVSPLDYGKQYQLKILDGKIKKADGSSPLSESSIMFNTTCFNQVTASAVTTGASDDGLKVTTILTSVKDQNFKISYVVRRDKGARLEDGGTVVINSTVSNSCIANNQSTYTLDIPDITVDQYGNLLTRAVYVDLYILNNSGNAIFDPIHIRVE